MNIKELAKNLKTKKKSKSMRSFAVLNDLPEQLDEEVLKFRGVEADDILAWMVRMYLTNMIILGSSHQTEIFIN